MPGLTLRNRIRNEEIRKTGITDTIEPIERLKWNWASHIARINWRSWSDKRSRIRPPTRWRDDIKRIAGSWLQAAQDRHGWRRQRAG